MIVLKNVVVGDVWICSGQPNMAVRWGGPKEVGDDEIETPVHRININPKPHHLAFKKAWWEVSRLALSVLPHRAQKLAAPFSRPPRKWYVKRAIQSK